MGLETCWRAEIGVHTAVLSSRIFMSSTRFSVSMSTTLNEKQTSNSAYDRVLNWFASIFRSSQFTHIFTANGRLIFLITQSFPIKNPNKNIFGRKPEFFIMFELLAVPRVQRWSSSLPSISSFALLSWLCIMIVIIGTQTAAASPMWQYWACVSVPFNELGGYASTKASLHFNILHWKSAWKREANKWKIAPVTSTRRIDTFFTPWHVMKVQF